MKRSDSHPLGHEFNSNWSIVLSSIELTVKLPFRLSENCLIKLANDEEIDQFKAVLCELLSKKQLFYKHEFRCTQKIDTHSVTSEFVPLNREDWLYYSIITTENEQELHNLHLASQVCRIPFELTALSFNSYSYGYRDHILYRYFDKNKNPTQTVHESDLQDLAQIYAQFSTTVSRYPVIKTAFEMYDQLNFIQDESNFRAIGLFAIIELLMTYQSDDDPISSQIIRNMNQLYQKIDLRSDLPNKLKHFKVYKIWRALYDYRSAVAHGSEPGYGTKEFTRGSRKDFINTKISLDYLKKAVKLVLRHALRDPIIFDSFQTNAVKKRYPAKGGASTRNNTVIPRKAKKK